MKIKQAHGNLLRLPLNEFLHLYNKQAFPSCFCKNHIQFRHHHEKWDNFEFRNTTTIQAYDLITYIMMCL